MPTGYERSPDYGDPPPSPYRWRVRLVALLALIAFAAVLLWPR
jgi:hypothetical protein